MGKEKKNEEKSGKIGRKDRKIRRSEQEVKYSPNQCSKLKTTTTKNNTSNNWRLVTTLKVKVKVKSCPTLCYPVTVAHQAPPPMGFSRQEYWSGLPFPSPGDLPDPGIEPRSPALQADALSSEPPGKNHIERDH